MASLVGFFFAAGPSASLVSGATWEQLSAIQ